MDVLLHAAGRPATTGCSTRWTKALAAHVIEETADGQYQFTHNLIRMTLYDELRTARRRSLHRAVGKAIEALHRADVDAFLPELARHFHAAGDIDRAIDYATRAGQRADALLAFEDAVQFFQAALDGIEQGEPDELARCRLLLLLGEAQRKANDYPRALETLRGCRRGRDGAGRGRSYWRARRWPMSMPPGAVPYLAIRRRRFCWNGRCVSCPRDHATLRAQVAGALARALVYAGAAYGGTGAG